MKKQLSWLLIAALILTLVLPIGTAAAANNTGSAYETTKQLAEQKAKLLTDTLGVTSVQYALIDQGDITVSGQAGVNRKLKNAKLTADTLYGIGSTSKTFTATAVMKLVDEGKIDLDAPLTRYITDFKMKDERYKQITPRMLLNHSSGLLGSTFGSTFLLNDSDTTSHDTLLQRLSEQRLKADPGEFSVYCNDGFTLAEILVERVSGMDFTAFIHQYITGPLGLKHTLTPQDQVNVKDLAGTYIPGSPIELPRESVTVIGTGGLYSTAEDLVKFAQIFTGEAQGVISAKSAAAMGQAEYQKGIWPDEADSIISYGMGWDSVKMFPFADYGIQAVAKGGDTIMYHASLVVLPEQKMAAAVLSSGGSSTLNQLLAQEMLLSALKEKGVIQSLKPDKSFGVPVKATMPQDLVKYAGIYGALNQIGQVNIKDGVMTLLSTTPGVADEKYIYIADGSFVSEDGMNKVSFVTETNGRTYLWLRSYEAIPDLGQTAISQYLAEKLEDNKLSEDVAAAWDKRKDQYYFPLNEKYTSIIYVLGLPATQLVMTDAAPGYLFSNRIVSANETINELQIPVMSGRDLMDYQFYENNGVEYMKAADSLFVEQSAVMPIYAGAKSAVTIQADGYARWFTISDAAAGKTMKVDLPAHGSYAVYDQNGACVTFSEVKGVKEVKLPANGVIMFAGEAGAKFGITMKK